MNTNIGIDAVKCLLSGKYLVKDKISYPKEKPFLHVKPNSDGTEIVIVLPRLVRSNNIIAFGILDSVHLDMVIQETNRALKKLFDCELHMLAVKGVEVPVTISFDDAQADVDICMNFASRVMPETDIKKPLKKYTVGKLRKGCKYLKDEFTQSFSTKTDSNRRLSWNVYSKGKGSQFGGELNILRWECRYNKRGIEHVLKKPKDETIYLTDILTRKAIILFIKQLQIDFIAIICPKIRGFLSDAEYIVLNELRNGIQPYKALIRHLDIINYDIEIFSKALKKYYKENGKNDGSFRTALTRYKKKMKQDNLPIHTGTIGIFVAMKKALKDAI